MTTAATTTYQPTAQRLIDLALMDIGVAGQAGSVDPNLRVQALDILNLLLKELDDEGAFLTNITRRIQTLTAGVSSYVLTNDVRDLDEPARYTASGATYGSQVTAMARDEYMTLPDRTIQGPVYRYYAEKGLDANGIQQVTLYLFPVPPNTGDTLEYAACLRTKDITDVSQTIPLPQNWYQAIRYGLAAGLAPSYGRLDLVAGLQKSFEDKREKALEDDNERGNVQAVAFGNQYGYGYGQWSSGGTR